ncbi:speckle targeted PIP5K1A-regulated poly(A) polymerase-like [Trichogramma pretiosum]|uniref:speckle targeted PIP5K1A-regulated poly(A) polymerase-like n=1 Tax=Trichogramma pretiosum TaxID=7493 RepID=UPI0006C98688|nr:speckle targeted PIP5K1A-regulated poly(A) polymerase-like [Trichogramma pretiosum]XP_014226715.1 speckle targeted PIP5K1A-regulated poly(A) polymerase-like [Trichogramma pretiosum]
MSNYCEICEMVFVNESALVGHQNGKKHKRAASRVNLFKDIAERSIFITGFPTYMHREEFLAFLSQYGKIYKHFWYPKHVIVEFERKEPVIALLKQPVFFSNVKLKIKPRTMPKTFEKKVEKPVPAINDTQDLIFENIKSIFDGVPNFDESLRAFINEVAMTQQDLETRYEPTIIQLTDIFRQQFPHCIIHRFGSSVSGLGFKNCDLDIFLDTGLRLVHEKDECQDPNSITPTTVFAEVKRKLYGKRNLFTKVVPIPKAKTPIIKCIYIPSHISCDISFKNSLAVYNSKMMRYYLSLDPRLQPTMMVIKYWLSNLEIKNGDRMSKYALMLLFLFYLQQPTVKIVPPIYDLKKNCIPEVVEGWQVNYEELSTPFEQPEISKTKSIPQLLQGFFEFYKEYDFKNNIVCPLDGQSHLKSEFQEIDQLPECMDRYKSYIKNSENPVVFPTTTCMCVQDPNELNHSVTAGVSYKYLQNFQSNCDLASIVCAKESENNYKDLLPNLFTAIVKPKQNSRHVKKYTFVVYAKKLLKAGLPKDLDSRTDIKDKSSFMNDHWFNLITRFTEIYLEKVLRFNVRMTHVAKDTKQQKVDDQSDVHSNDMKKVVFHCLGEQILWTNRKNSQAVLDPSISGLAKEIDVTNRIINDVESSEKFPKINMDFECHIIQKKGPNVHVNFSLVNNNCPQNVYSDLVCHLQNRMINVFRKTATHMIQYGKTNLNA